MSLRGTMGTCERGGYSMSAMLRTRGHSSVYRLLQSPKCNPCVHLPRPPSTVTPPTSAGISSWHATWVPHQTWPFQFCTLHMHAR